MTVKNRRKRLREKLYKLQGGKCCYCGRAMRPHVHKHNLPDMATLEHLKRECDGGTMRLDNVACACLECNTGRGDTDWLTYKSMKMGEI